MPSRSISQIRPAQAATERPLLSRTVIEKRASVADYQAHRAVRMLKMLTLLADGTS